MLLNRPHTKIEPVARSDNHAYQWSFTRNLSNFDLPSARSVTGYGMALTMQAVVKLIPNCPLCPLGLQLLLFQPQVPHHQQVHHHPLL